MYHPQSPASRHLPWLLKVPLHQSCGNLKQALPSKLHYGNYRDVEGAVKKRKNPRRTWNPRGVIKGQLEAAIAADMASDRTTELLLSWRCFFFLLSCHWDYFFGLCTVPIASPSLRRGLHAQARMRLAPWYPSFFQQNSWKQVTYSLVSK